MHPQIADAAHHAASHTGYIAIPLILVALFLWAMWSWGGRSQARRRDRGER